MTSRTDNKIVARDKAEVDEVMEKSCSTKSGSYNVYCVVKPLSCEWKMFGCALCLWSFFFSWSNSDTLTYTGTYKGYAERLK